MAQKILASKRFNCILLVLHLVCFVHKMFRSTHPAKELLLPFLDSLSESSIQSIYIGNSWDFHVGGVAVQKGVKVHGIDDSIVGQVIASLLFNENISLKCMDSDLALLFSGWKEHRYKPLVEILFALKVAPYVAQKNDYQKTMFWTYCREATSFFASNVTALEKKKFPSFNISTFRFGSIQEHLSQIPEGSHGIVNLLPLSERKTIPFRFIEKIFTLGESVNPLRHNKSFQNYSQMLDSSNTSIFSSIEIPELAGFLKGKIKIPRGREFHYLYSNFENSPIIYHSGKKAKPCTQTVKIIPSDFVIPENASISIMKCKTGIVDYYKQLFMSNRVDYSQSGDLAIAFLVDNVVFGFASFFQRMKTMDRDRFIYMNSDFVVPSGTPRLSKLLLHLILSDDVRRIISRQYLYAYPSIQTTVFTDKPVSMKYRGVFQKTGENNDGKLTYIADFTTDTKQEKFQRWKKRITIRSLPSGSKK